MAFSEEAIAADLYQELTQRFCATTNSCSLQGAGVQWHCTVQRGNSNCLVHCFRDVHSGPEYYTKFERDSTICAIGRSKSREQTIVAASDWLDGVQLSELYARHLFVDRTKRALSRLLSEVMSSAPELPLSIQGELKVEYGDSYSLRFNALDRACEVSIYGDNELPEAKFSWDDCLLFQFQSQDRSQLAGVLKRWLCDHALPSAMQKEFPWLKIDELATYYENGQPILGGFLRSWDKIETHYLGQKAVFGEAESVLQLISDMREAGYDRVLRAGQSLWSLGLSRARRHGLMPGQSSVWFNFRNSLMNVCIGSSNVILKDVPIRFSPEVKAVVDSLVELSID